MTDWSEANEPLLISMQTWVHDPDVQTVVRDMLHAAQQTRAGESMGWSEREWHAYYSGLLFAVTAMAAATDLVEQEEHHDE